MTTADRLLYLRRQLPEIAERLHWALHALQHRTEANRCEQVAIELQGATRHCLALREVLQQDEAA